MSSAAAAVPPPGQRSGPSYTAELLCALSYGSGLAVAEQMEHGTNTAFAGMQLGRALGLPAQDLEAVFYGALIKDVGCGARSCNRLSPRSRRPRRSSSAPSVATSTGKPPIDRGRLRVWPAPTRQG
jgi:hypothetical protein